MNAHSIGIIDGRVYFGVIVRSGIHDIENNGSIYRTLLNAHHNDGMRGLVNLGVHGGGFSTVEDLAASNPSGDGMMSGWVSGFIKHDYRLEMRYSPMHISRVWVVHKLTDGDAQIVSNLIGGSADNHSGDRNDLLKYLGAHCVIDDWVIQCRDMKPPRGQGRMSRLLKSKW